MTQQFCIMKNLMIFLKSCKNVKKIMKIIFAVMQHDELKQLRVIALIERIV